MGICSLMVNALAPGPLRAGLRALHATFFRFFFFLFYFYLHLEEFFFEQCCVSFCHEERVLVSQLYLTLHNPMDRELTRLPVRGILEQEY